MEQGSLKTRRCFSAAAAAGDLCEQGRGGEDKEKVAAFNCRTRAQQSGSEEGGGEGRGRCRRRRRNEQKSRQLAATAKATAEASETQA